MRQGSAARWFLQRVCFGVRATGFGLRDPETKNKLTPTKNSHSPSGVVFFLFDGPLVVQGLAEEAQLT